jgi:signal transduction histidine kinase
MKRVRHIYLAFAISFIVTIIISILYLEEFSALQKSNEDLEKSYQVRNKILKIQSDLIASENIQLEYLITEDNQLLHLLSATQVGIYKEIEKLKVLTKDVDEQQKIIANLKETISLKFQILYQTTDAENSSNLTVFLDNRKKGKDIMAVFMSLSAKMDEVEANLLTDRKRRSEGLQIVTSFYLKLILILSIVFQLVSFIIITRAFKKRKVYQRILENKIKELNQSNSEMEQIAFVASHDLQEPLRKIRTFSDKLIKQHIGDLGNEGQLIIEKIASASSRMQELLSDFIDYTQVAQSSEEIGVVPLDRVIEDVREQFNDQIEIKKATLQIEPLPSVTGYNKQLHLLFANLLDNALKFSKTSIPPGIKITYTANAKSELGDNKIYNKISFSDDGIGFEKEFVEKIFIIFQRLHSQHSTYVGKGIGLAICKRVMVNHGGYITASGQAEVGATFNLYFPKATD